MTETPNYDDQYETARFALAVLTMRHNTPGGDWLSGEFEDYYLAGWRELSEAQGDDVNEMVFLDMLNMANMLLELLVKSTDLPSEYFLQYLREGYVDPPEEPS